MTACKEKYLIISSMVTWLTNLCETHATKFAKSAEFFRLLVKYRRAVGARTRARLVFRSADAEADVADGFAAEALF